MASPSRSTQKLAVTLAFVAAAASLAAAALAWFSRGELAVVPLAGGLVMLFLGVSGISRLKASGDRG